MDHSRQLIVHARGRVAVFVEDPDDDGTGKALRSETAECRDDVKAEAGQAIPIAHICRTFRVIVDTRHEQILT